MVANVNFVSSGRRADGGAVLHVQGVLIAEVGEDEMILTKLCHKGAIAASEIKNSGVVKSCALFGPELPPSSLVTRGTFSFDKNL